MVGRRRFAVGPTFLSGGILGPLAAAGVAAFIAYEGTKASSDLIDRFTPGLR